MFPLTDEEAFDMFIRTYGGIDNSNNDIAAFVFKSSSLIDKYDGSVVALLDTNEELPVAETITSSHKEAYRRWFKKNYSRYNKTVPYYKVSNYYIRGLDITEEELELFWATVEKKNEPV